MFIVTCECGKRFQVKEEQAGRKAKCSCGRVFRVPGSGSAGAPQTAAAPVAPGAGQTAGGDDGIYGFADEQEPTAGGPGQRTPDGSGGDGASSKSPQLIVLNDDEMAILKKHFSNINQLASLAFEYHKKGQFNDALSCCRILLKMNPDHSLAWRQCGVVLCEMEHGLWKKQGLKQYEGTCENMTKAIGYLDRAIELNPKDNLSWYFKGHCLGHIACKTGNVSLMDQALACFDKALAIKPDDFKAIVEGVEFREARQQLAAQESKR